MDCEQNKDRNNKMYNRTIPQSQKYIRFETLHLKHPFGSLYF